MSLVRILFISLIYCIFTTTDLLAQLPHIMSGSERSMMPSYLDQITQRNQISNPPASPIRAMAEWEEIDGLLVTWTGYQSILTEIVRHARVQTHVYVVCSDSNAVRSSLTSAGVPLSNITYLVAPFNSVWARDYGQWNVYTNDVDSLLLIDWIYNRPRPADDNVPNVLAAKTGLPIYSMTSAPYDLIHTGGNFMVDGMGLGFSSNLILDENPGKTSANIDTIMKAFMGLDRYAKMTVLPFDGIHHIDMHMKLLDEETLLMGSYPNGVSDGPQIEANLLYVLSNYPTTYGTPWKVIRIPQPPSTGGAYPPSASYRTYTNSVFINNTILVPTYYQQYDTTALRIYREALPGYNVIGINCNSIISASGALHCITKEVGSSDPLWITHKQLENTFDTSNPYPVVARAQHRSGVNAVSLWYTTDTLQPYTSISLMQGIVPGNEWFGSIPAQVAGTTVYYFLEAMSASGKTGYRPMPAPAGYYKFKVGVLTQVFSQEIPSSFSAIFPNPSKGITCFQFDSKKITEGELRIYDQSGRVVFVSEKNRIIIGENRYFIDTTNWSAGSFVAELYTKDFRIRGKLMVR